MPSGDAVHGGDLVLQVRDVRKTYGNTRALRGASLDVRAGEMVGIAGHNGAGKTTLMKVVGGRTVRDSGDIALGGVTMGPRFGVLDARARGIAVAMQEISLFPELRVIEQLGAASSHRVKPRWRATATEVVRAQLDAIFPSNRIDPLAFVFSLTLAERQMLQIALAAINDTPLNLLVLDEPTSSLPEDLARELFAYLHRARGEDGLGVVLISHKMDDIFAHTDRTVVMRDGAMVSDLPTARASLNQVMIDMGAGEGIIDRLHTGGTGADRQPRAAVADDAVPVVEASALSWRGLRDVSLRVRPGEIVGLAGLEGSGQGEILEAVWRSRRARPWRRRARSVALRGRAAYVSGDRQSEGLFPLWGVQRNVSIGNLRRLGAAGFVSSRRERVQAQQWISDLAIKADPETAVTALSGGTQQKVLLARGLAQTPDLLILDDPFRGVDITTKTDAYARLRQFTDSGAAVLWYTSENAELLECDRVYVIHDGTVSAELSGAELTLAQLIEKSFGAPDERTGEPS